MNVQVSERVVRQESRLAIVDCDIHPAFAASPSKELAPYLDPRWIEHLKVYGSHHRHGMSPGQAYPHIGGDRLDAKPPKGGSPGSDLDFMRQNHLDPYNIEIGILQPFVPDGIAQRNQDFGNALCRATNDWQTAKWLEQEPRLRGSILLPREDAPACVAEIERLAEHPLYVQAWTKPGGLEPMGRRRYWPIYEACAHYKIPLGVHVGSVTGYAKTPAGHPSFYLENHVAGGMTYQSALISLLLEGVFERFPDFRLVLIETGYSWVPSMLWRLDKHWKRLRSEVPHLKMAPSEYVKRQVWFTTQPVDEPLDRSHLSEVMDWIGWDRILFSTDYPHWDQDDPRFVFRMPISEENRRRVFRENASGVYGLGLE